MRAVEEAEFYFLPQEGNTDRVEQVHIMDSAIEVHVALKALPLS